MITITKVTRVKQEIVETVTYKISISDVFGAATVCSILAYLTIHFISKI